MSYKPTLPVRIDPPDQRRVLEGMAYWNLLASPIKTLFVIDRVNPQVTWATGPWGAVGPYPDTDNKWVLYHPDGPGSIGEWRPEAHELGHVLYGDWHPSNPRRHGVMGDDPGDVLVDMAFDRDRLKRKGLL